MRGVKSRTTGTQMHGSGLKWKYRAHAEAANIKGKATRGKK